MFGWMATLGKIVEKTWRKSCMGHRVILVTWVCCKKAVLTHSQESGVVESFGSTLRHTTYVNKYTYIYIYICVCAICICKYIPIYIYHSQRCDGMHFFFATELHPIFENLLETKLYPQYPGVHYVTGCFPMEFRHSGPLWGCRFPLGYTVGCCEDGLGGVIYAVGIPPKNISSGEWEFLFSPV